MDGITPVIDRYFEIWNETNPARRRALIALTWTDDACYLDPLMSGEGPEGIDAMIQGVQNQFPDHLFRRIGEIDAHHDRVRFGWELVLNRGQPVAAGVDFGELADDGRLIVVTGFLNQATSN